MHDNYLWLFLCAMNVIGFILVASDKFRAKRGRWRLPEKRFFTVSFFGGAFGVYLGMQLFRHKTQHKKFIYGVPLLILVNAAVVYCIVSLR